MAMVKIENVGEYGVISDLTPAELPPNAWSRAENIRFRDQYAERFEGQNRLFAQPSVTPYFISPYSTVDTRWWIHAGLSQVFADNGQGRDEITPAFAPAGGIDDRYTGGVLNGVFVLNNGIDVPWYWGGTGVLQQLPAWPIGLRASAMRSYKDWLILLGTNESGTHYPHRVRWSAAAEPGTLPTSWSLTDPTNDAGEVDLAETPGLLIDCLPLGNVNCIYGQDAMYAQSPLNDANYIFNFQRLPGDFGLLARGCVASFPGGHVVLAPGDVVIHSGQGPKSILSGRQRRTLFANIDATYYARSFLVSNLLRNEVWICYPESGSDVCTRALVWNWAENTFADRDLANVTYGASGPVVETANTDKLLLQTGAFMLLQDGGEITLTGSAGPQIDTAEARLVTCSTVPAISVVDKGDTFTDSDLLLQDGGFLLLQDGGKLILSEGEAFTATLERVDLVFDDQDMTSQKTIRAVIPRVEAAAGTELSIQTGGRNDVEVDVTWDAAITYTVGTSRKADVRSTWRFPAIRISSDADKRWRLKSYDLDVTKGGTR